MINAPQVVIDALKSGNFSYANLITINLGDAYGVGSDVTLYLTDYGHSISFNGNSYTPDHNLTEIEGISRKASTGSDKVDIVFSVTDEVLIDVIKSERYINQPTSIDRVIIQDGVVLGDFSIPVRTAWGLSHSISGDQGDRSITLTIDSTLGDLDGNNGWFAVNASHEQRYAGDKIMKHSGTVMTEEQQKKYTANFSGVISEEIKPPALSKIYGYKNVELVPICMLKHRKSHTSYRHYFTTLIYAINIGDCQSVDIRNLRKGGEAFDFTVVNNSERDVGGWSCRVRTPQDADASTVLDEEQGDLSFWFEGMDSSEKSRMQGMIGKGLTLLFFKNRNRDDWLQTPPKLTIPVSGSPVYDPRSGQTVFSRNPALQYADYLRSSQYGAGKRNIPVDDVNISALADHFDQIPDSQGNSGINSILIDVQVDTGQAIVDNMNIWMEGVRLYTSDYYGRFNVRVETKASTSMVINEDDLIGYPDYESGEFTDRLNQLTYTIKQLVPDTSEDAVSGDLVEVDVEATFPPDNSQIHIDWLAEDGGIQNFDSEQLDYVTTLEQAYYWAMVDSRISRLPRTLDLSLNAIGWLTEVGDVIEFTSDVMAMNSVKWRVEEVSEDDGEVQLKCKAYSDSFYTPDPNAIPDPVAPAQPPTKSNLSPVSGLAVTVENELYYLAWDALSSANVAWYAVEVHDLINGGVIYEDPKVSQPPFLLEGISEGNYRADVIAVAVGGEEGQQSVINFTISAPDIPTVTVTPSDLSAQLVCSTSNNPVGQKFELMFSLTNNQNTANSLGYSSGAFSITGLRSATNYYYWARTISPIGISDWVSGAFTTTADGSAITDLIGEDIAQQILPDVIDSVNQDLQNTVDEALTDYPTTDQTQTLIDDSLDAIGATDSDDNRISIVDAINSILDNYETEGDVKTETLERKTEIEQVKSSVDNSVASVAQVSQSVSELESATAKQLETVNASLSDNVSEVSKVSQALVTESEARADDVTQLNARADENEASIIQTNTALASESETRASQVSQLNANNTAIINSINSVQSDVDGNSQAISAVSGAVTDPVTGNTAIYGLAQSAKTDAEGNAQAITVIQNKVDDPTAGLTATNQIAQSAKSSADGSAQAVTQLSSRVSDAESEAESALTLATSVNNSLDSYRATAQLAVDVNGNASFIQLDATPTNTQVKFKGDQIFFLDDRSNPVVYWDTVKKQYVFVGGLSVSQEMRSPKIEFVGTSYMMITSAVGFGVNNEFIEWYGLKHLKNGNEVDYSKLTRSNAITYKTVDGSAYFGGSLTAGILKNGVANSKTTNYTSGEVAVEIGTFGTNGDPKRVVVSWDLNASSQSTSSCPTSPTEPSMSFRLERSLDSGASWQLLTTGTLNGSTSTEFDDGEGKCFINETVNDSLTFTDNSSMTVDFMYRVVVTGYSRYHTTANVNSQRVSIISTEE